MPLRRLDLQLLTLHLTSTCLRQNLLLRQLGILGPQLFDFSFQFLFRELVERVLTDISQASFKTLDDFLVLVHDLIKLALVNQVSRLQLS